MDFHFLTLDEVLMIHADQIQRYGGALGLRDIGLLQSAIAMPYAQFNDTYLHKDIFEMAAAYLFHITSNHPFLDGNKRVALVSALVFLLINGIEITVDENKLEAMVIAVSTDSMGKAEIALFFQRYANPIQ